MFILLPLKKINDRIGQILRNGAKLQTLVHDTAIQCLLHAETHGDARPMNALRKAMPPAMRIKGFEEWVKMFSPIRWNAEGSVSLAKPDAKGYMPFNIEAANDTPFWEATEEKVKVTDLSIETVLAMLKRTLKQAQAADADGNITNKEGVVTKRIVGNVAEFKDWLAKKAA